MTIKKELLLDNKLERVLQLSTEVEPIGPTGPTGPAFAEEGFSAIANNIVVNTSGQITSWVSVPPYIASPDFDPLTGVYTVPSTGRYHISAVISYQTTASIGISLGNDINPSFVIRNITTNTNMLAGLFPILNTSLVILTARVILGSGTITIVGDVELNAGDQIGLFYENSGLTIDLNLGGLTIPIIWSMHRIA